jgi:hypothetical protein
MFLQTFESIMRILSNGVPGVVFAGAAIVLMLIGLVIENSVFMVIGAILTFPFTYTMGGSRGVSLVIRFLPLLQLGAAFAISKREMLIAWVAPILPFLLLLAYLLRVILAQFPK